MQSLYIILQAFKHKIIWPLRIELSHFPHITVQPKKGSIKTSESTSNFLATKGVIKERVEPR